MKALLLDADGVVFNKGEYFSERFAREYGVPSEKVVAFFKGPFVLCQKGDADLKVEIKPYLEDWNWSGSVDSFLKYWFESDCTINDNIKDLISKYRGNGVKCYLASNNEIYRSDFLKDLLQKENILDGTYFSGYLKVRKENPEFFQKILNDLNTEPSGVYFVDNEEKNVASARSLGINAKLYTEDVLRSWLGKV